MRGPVVKRGGADFVSRASRTSPSPSASVDLAHLRPVRGRIGRAARNTSSEPEAEGDRFSLNAGSVRSVGRRDVIRSTIDSGSPHYAIYLDIAKLLEQKEFWDRCLQVLRSKWVPEIVLIPEHAVAPQIRNLVLAAFDGANLMTERLMRPIWIHFLPSGRLSPEVQAHVEKASNLLIADDAIVTVRDTFWPSIAVA